MALKRNILLATASIAIGFVLTPVQAQTAKDAGPAAAPGAVADDGAGLPLPPPPHVKLAKPGQSGPALNAPKDCESIRQEIARLEAERSSYLSSAAKAGADSQKEAQLAKAAFDTWQREEQLWHSTSQASQNTQNPADKSTLQSAAGKHYWQAQQAKSDYEYQKHASESDASFQKTFLGMASRTAEKISALKIELQAACAEHKVAGNEGTGSGMQPGGAYNYGSGGPAIPLGGSDTHNVPSVPPGGNLSKPDGGAKSPAKNMETPKKSSALPKEIGGLPIPTDEQQQINSAPDFRAYFASRAQNAGGYQAAPVQLYDPAPKNNDAIHYYGAPVSQATNTGAIPGSQTTARADATAMTAGGMPVRVQEPIAKVDNSIHSYGAPVSQVTNRVATPASQTAARSDAAAITAGAMPAHIQQLTSTTAQTLSENPMGRISAPISAERRQVVHSPANAFTVSTYNNRVGPTNLIGR
jgi:hypothetical protein